MKRGKWIGQTCKRGLYVGARAYAGTRVKIVPGVRNARQDRVV